MCGLTSGLATADMTEGPFVRVLRSIAALDKTELCRHRVHRESHYKLYKECA